MLIQTFYDMITRVTELLSEGSAQITRTDSPLSSDKIANHLNSAYQNLNNIAIRKWNRQLLTFIDVTVTDTATGKTDYVIGPFSPEPIFFEKRPSSNETTFRYDLNNRLHGSSFNAECKYEIRGDGYIYVLDSSDTQFRLWYMRVPATMHYGTLSAGTKTSVTFTSPPTYGKLLNIDNICVGDFVHLPSTGELAKITGYVAATHVATVVPLSGSGDAFSAAPGTAAYSIVPWFPARFYELVALLAASYFVKMPVSSQLNTQIAVLMSEYDHWLSPDTSVKRIQDSGRVTSPVGTISKFPDYIMW